MNYRPEIDGLRALAVVPVLFYHANFSIFSGGFIGVDVFFVISGFLITNIILSETECGNFSLLNFYERRARRILPALFVVVSASIIYAWFWLLPVLMEEFSLSVVSTFLFAANIYFWKQSGYFAPETQETPLSHTWSLAVEEQFYLVFPIFLIFFWRFGPLRLLLVLSCLILVSLLVSEWGSKNHPSATFYLLPTRMWEFLAGSFAAVLSIRFPPTPCRWKGSFGVLLIVGSFMLFNHETRWPSLITTIPIAGTVMVLMYAKQDSLPAKLLSFRPLVLIGLVSYSLYLWHQPLFAFTRLSRVEDISLNEKWCILLLAFVLATFTWLLVEKPIRKLKQPKIKRRVFVVSTIVITVLLVSIGGLGNLYQGFPGRFERVLVGDVGHKVFFEHLTNNYKDCEPQLIREKALTHEGHLRCKQSRTGEPDWILLGDSHAEHLFIGLAEHFPIKNVSYYILDGSPVISNREFKHIFEVLGKFKNKTIFLTMHYHTRLYHQPQQDAFYDEMRATIDYLDKFGHQIVLVGDVARHRKHAEECVYSAETRQSLSYCSMQDDCMGQRYLYEIKLEKLAIETPATHLEIYQPFCVSNRSSMVVGDKIMYRDTNHLNILGSRAVGQHIGESLGAEFLNKNGMPTAGRKITPLKYGADHVAIVGDNME